MSYTTTLIGKRAIAEGTVEFTFARPEGFTWKAGQSIDLTLIAPSQTDGEGNTRAYSLVSAPHEDVLTIATRMRDSAFKRILGRAESGYVVEVAGPFGDFTLHEKESRPAIMLTGGIGITPFYSMLKDAMHRALRHRIVVFFSNRRPEDAPYLEELRTLEKENPRIAVIPTMTKLEASQETWSGEVGYITHAMIDRYARERENAFYYSAGPERMVVGMRELLAEMRVSSDDMRIEEFSRY